MFLTLVSLLVLPARADDIVTEAVQKHLQDAATAIAWTHAGFESAPSDIRTVKSDGNSLTVEIARDTYTLTSAENGAVIAVGGGNQAFLPASFISNAIAAADIGVRAHGKLSDATFKSSLREHVYNPAVFEPSTVAYQCTSDLPSRYTPSGSIINRTFNHTWLQLGPAISYGMPNTDTRSYFGGRAHIRSPDSFVYMDPKHLECTPIDVRKGTDFDGKIACIANALSAPQHPLLAGGVNRQFILHLDYHALEHNCLSAVRFIAECAGGYAPWSPNVGVGGFVGWDVVYSMTRVTNDFYVVANLASQISSLVRAMAPLESFKPQNSSELLMAIAAVNLNDRAIGTLVSNLARPSAGQSPAEIELAALSLSKNLYDGYLTPTEPATMWHACQMARAQCR